MIHVKKLAKYYGQNPALKNVSFEVASAGATVIFGPSGCGKTTLLRLLAGLDEPDEGEIYLDNLLVSKPGMLVPSHERGIGFVFQSPALWPHLTVAKNISFGLHSLTAEEAKKRVREVLAQVGASELAERYPDEISTGQARRVALARSIAPHPKYLFMDEPLSNLDSRSKEKLVSLIHQIAQDKRTFLLYVTHNLKEAKDISERMLLMEEGGSGAPPD